jgi:hypothetical protein
MTSASAALQTSSCPTAFAAYIDNDHDTSFVSELVGTYFAEPEGGEEVAAGLINLSGMLLYNLAKARGDESVDGQRAILQEFAKRVVRRGGSPDGGGAV